MATRKMSNVSSKYGAPMGRSHYGKAEECLPNSVYLYQVPLCSGGYDNGGAYWGIGGTLYCAEDVEGEYRGFTRASSRNEAMELLGLKPEQLKSKTGIHS